MKYMEFILMIKFSGTKISSIWNIGNTNKINTSYITQIKQRFDIIIQSAKIK